VRFATKAACAVSAAGLVFAAGPLDFGEAELRAAAASRNLNPRITTEVSLDPPEAFRIEPSAAGGRITGGDLRGLMYGLLEAAGQVRAGGRLKAVRSVPSLRMRSVRIAVEPADLAQVWFRSEADWRAYFQILARARINRLTLIVPAPPNPGEWLRALPAWAASYGVDFVLGFSRLPATPADAHAAIVEALSASPMIRGLAVEAAEPASFALWRDGVFRAMKTAGRRVTLDLPASALRAEMAAAAESGGVPLQLSVASGEQRPSLRHEFYWLYRDETASPAESLAPLIAAGGAAGFEIEVPPSHLRDGSVVSRGEFYSRWGRLGYGSKSQPTPRKP
jgi:hypothetical protein